MTVAATAIPIIDDAADIAANYDAWFCDIWGVIHNGKHRHERAVDACQQYRAAGGRVVFITNAPRPAAPIVEQLEMLGVSADAYDAIVTSGDVTRALIDRYRGRPVYHLGPDRDLTLFDGLDVQLAKADVAEVIVNTGLFDDYTETPADYADSLAAFKARGVPMICANPDIVVERGAEICYCAGALAEAYGKIGGEVAYAGKPHPPIYDACFEKLASTVDGVSTDKSRVLAIGDGLKTDMLGALSYGLDALFVPSGVHVTPGRPLDSDLLGELFTDHPARPVAAIAGLSWSP